MYFAEIFNQIYNLLWEAYDSQNSLSDQTALQWVEKNLNMILSAAVVYFLAQTLLIIKEIILALQILGKLLILILGNKHHWWNILRNIFLIFYNLLHLGWVLQILRETIVWVSLRVQKLKLKSIKVFRRFWHWLRRLPPSQVGGQLAISPRSQHSSTSSSQSQDPNRPNSQGSSIFHDPPPGGYENEDEEEFEDEDEDE